MGGSPPSYIALQGWILQWTFEVEPSVAGIGSAGGVCRPKMGLNGPSRGLGNPVGQPAPNGAPSGPPSSGQLIGGPWCCSFVFPWTFVWFGMSFGPWILVSASDLSEVSFYLDLGVELICGVALQFLCSHTKLWSVHLSLFEHGFPLYADMVSWKQWFTKTCGND